MSFEAFIQGILAESQSTYFIYLNVTLKEQTTQSTLTFKQFINLNILVSHVNLTLLFKTCYHKKYKTMFGGGYYNSGQEVLHA
jgi:hypothetical protein